MSGSSQTTSTAVLRLRCGFALAAFAAAWLAPLAHFAFVPHVVCPEHGEVEHSDGHGHGGDHTPAPLDSTDHHSIALDDDGEADEEHLGCELSLMGSSRSCPTKASLAYQEDVDRRLELRAGDTRALGAVAVYRWAPKTSPPVS